jgi:LDH2 family malate/lactate/ureidoglycolate dehydrogenase
LSTAPRYRVDDLRRLGASLGVAAGLSGTRAAALVGYLLWHDTAGAWAHGIRLLPRWLDRLEAGEVLPLEEGRITAEVATAAVLEARAGVGPLILGRAASIASDKARELGMGMVRVEQLGPFGPAAEIAANVALGPMIALVLGPGPSWTLALPMAGDLPAVFDTALQDAAVAIPATPKKKGTAPAVVPMVASFAPWIAALAPPPGGWLVAVLAVAALESLSAFQERMEATLPDPEGPGQLLPEPWEARRRACREHGIELDNPTRDALRRRAAVLRLPPLDPPL